MIEIINVTAPVARLVNAEQASARLGVLRQTLYSYVSRGLIRAVPVPDDTRRSLYDALDIAGLIERRSRGRTRRAVASSTMDWGEPILRSSLTRIADGAFQYRGRDAVALSDTATLEEVAALLWDGPVPFVPLAPSVPAGQDPFERCLRAVADEAARSDWGTQRAHVAGVAARLLGVMARAASGTAGHGCAGAALHMRMAAAWGIGTAGADLIRRALVLCADHELNASAYAARVVASTGASLGACVLAGLSALSGPRHGGMTDQVRALAADPDIVSDPVRAFGARLARGETLPGFGHRLYPDGDPRCAALLSVFPPNPPWLGMIEAASRLTAKRPTVDVALAMLEANLPLPPGGALALFATGRTVGWIAHALEQRNENRLIRPRAEYVPG